MSVLPFMCAPCSVTRCAAAGRYTVDVGPYKSTHRFCEDKTDVILGCRKRTLNERVNGWLLKMASVEVPDSFNCMFSNQYSANSVGIHQKTCMD